MTGNTEEMVRKFEQKRSQKVPKYDANKQSPLVLMISSCAINSSMEDGRYFSTHGKSALTGATAAADEDAAESLRWSISIWSAILDYESLIKNEETVNES